MSTAILTQLKPESEFLSLSPATGPIAPLRAAAVALPFPKSGGITPGRASVPAGRRQSASARRRVRLDWEAIAVILLMLSCAAVGLYRLIWMGQI